MTRLNPLRLESEDGMKKNECENCKNKALGLTEDQVKKLVNIVEERVIRSVVFTLASTFNALRDSKEVERLLKQSISSDPASKVNVFKLFAREHKS